MRRGAVGIVVVLAVSLGAATARAQEMPAMDEGARLADATGAIWGMATFETWLILGGATLAVQDGCGQDDDDLVCAGLLSLGAIGAGVASGLATDLANAPADGPFVWHHTLWGALTGMMLGFGLAGDDDETRGVLAVAGILIGGVIAGAYTWSQRDYLLHDPGANDGAHVMTWGVPIAGILGTIVGLMLDDDEPDTMGLVAAGASLLTYGIGIGMAEAGR